MEAMSGNKNDRPPGPSYPGLGYVLNVFEHELDGIYGRLARNEDHYADVTLQRSMYPMGRITQRTNHRVC